MSHATILVILVMPNPFANIITSEMKTLHKNMIDALLENSALTVPCRIIYEGDKYDDISGTNDFDPIGSKPASVYNHGGPRFSNSGEDTELDSATEIIYLAVIWDFRDWIRTSKALQVMNSPEMYVQTISKIDTLVTLRRASKVLMDTNLETKIEYMFERFGDPEPCGFGADTHISTMWKRIG